MNTEKNNIDTISSKTAGSSRLSFIPNLFTLLNLLFGCMAIAATLQNGFVNYTNENGQQLLAIPEKIWLASLFIGIAAVIDFLDGFVARLFKASSEMGKQLDSLADLVSFGVAPGVIVYQFLNLSLAANADGLNTNSIYILPAFIIPLAAAYRLARFNLDTAQSFSFKGMPVPAAGMLIAAFPLIYWYSDTPWMIQLLLNEWFWYAVIAFVSYLMVSTLPMQSLKFKDFSVKNNIPKIVLATIAVISFIFLKWAAIPVVIISYVLLSLLLKNKTA
jgi:CDP-diacylglycerol---serine O-phosphatidyltransferase